MNNDILNFPLGFNDILEETNDLGFEQFSDPLLGSFLSTLAATKPNGNFLELGTGSGLSAAWILQGMDIDSSLKTIESDEKLTSIAEKYIGHDSRISIITGQGEELILESEENSIDYIFADTWPGKYNHLEETLSLLKKGGLYIIDDMLPQETWPKGHDKKAKNLILSLEQREDLSLTKMDWSTGIVVCSKLY